MRTRKQPEPDEPQGAPEWMVTFSDCMTLLLTFFVLLLSFSSFDEKVFRKLKVIFSKSLPSVNPVIERDKDAFLAATQIEPTEELGEGSEKATLATGREDNLKEDTGPADFHSRKVFLVSSKKVFWGKGTAISSEGRNILATMASFLKEVPSRIVISENGWRDEEISEHFGLPRAWAVVEYLTTKQGLNKRRFSISAAGTVVEEGFKSSGPGYPGAEAERVLEIVLLERSIYN